MSTLQGMVSPKEEACSHWLKIFISKKEHVQISIRTSLEHGYIGVCFFTLSLSQNLEGQNRRDLLLEVQRNTPSFHIAQRNSFSGGQANRVSSPGPRETGSHSPGKHVMFLRKPVLFHPSVPLLDSCFPGKHVMFPRKLGLFHRTVLLLDSSFPGKHVMFPRKPGLFHLSTLRSYQHFCSISSSYNTFLKL
jgi:hypothetical protein